MPNFKIITDSGCDLPLPMQRELAISVIPLHVTFREKTIPDSVDEGLEEIYQCLRNGEKTSTSAANPDDWASVIEPVLQAGEDALVMVFSSGLSTTYQSAVIAAGDLAEAYPQRKIRVVDTLCAALGQGLLVWYAAQKQQSGMDLDAVAQWVEENKLHLCHWFTVDDLMYLKRGGRISAATAVMGTMLQIKPVLHMDNNGKLVNMSKTRGRKASIEALAKKVDELGGDYDNSTMFICQCDCLKDAEYLKSLLMRRPDTKNVFIGKLGAVISSHSGPGTLAVFFLGNER